MIKRTRFTSRQAAWLLMAATMIASPSAARDRVIRFGLTGDYPPYAQRQSDGSFAGSDVVIAKRVARALHARSEFVPTSWSSLVADMAGNRFDVAIGGLSVTPERAAVGTFSVRLLDDGKRPLARCGEEGKYRAIAAIDRPGVRVQVTSWPGMIVLTNAWFHAATVTVNPVEADLIPALLERRTDLWITDGVVADHMARRYPGRLCATTLTPFTHQDKAWLIRNDPSLIAGVNRALVKLISDGSWDKAMRAVL